MIRLPARIAAALQAMLDCGLLADEIAARHTGGSIFLAEEFWSLYLIASLPARIDMFPLIEPEHYARTYGVSGAGPQLLDFLEAGPMKRRWPHPLIRFDYAADTRPDLAEDLNSAEEMFRLLTERVVVLSPWLANDPIQALQQIREKRLPDVIAKWINPAHLNAQRDVKENDDWATILHFASVEDALGHNPSEEFNSLDWRDRAALSGPAPKQPFLHFIWQGRSKGFPIGNSAGLATVSKGDLVLEADAVPTSTDRHLVNLSKSTGQHTKDAELLTQTSRPTIAVAVHVFHQDVAEKIFSLLQRSGWPMAFYVTVPEHLEEQLTRRLTKLGFPFQIFVVDNRGRDVGPFLHILPRIISDEHEFLLKLHTKKSSHRSDRETWADDILHALASPEGLAVSMRELIKNPDVGFIGPFNHVLELSEFVGANRHMVSRLIRRLGLSVSVCKDQGYFIAGSMFLARTSALVPLNNLGLQQNDFEEENGQLDGTLAHAVERVFALSGIAAQKKLMIMGKSGEHRVENLKQFYR